MKLTFENKAGSTDFGIKQLKPRWSSLKKRVQTTKRFGGDGELEVGDEFVDGRTFTMDFEFTPTVPGLTIPEQDLEYSAFMNNIVGFFLKINGPFFLVDTDIIRRARILMASIDDAVRPGLEKRIAFMKLNFKFLEAYWEDNVQESQVDVVTSGNTYNIDNSGFIDAFPIIEIVPDAANPDLLIQNQTTGDSFILGSASFGIGTTFIIDSKNGTIFLDDGVTQVENSVALADGSGFIKLAPGVNTFLFQSAFGGVTITTRHRRRYAF